MNPDEMLIFKLRGMKTKEKKQAAAKPEKIVREESEAQVEQPVRESYSLASEPEKSGVTEPVPDIQLEEEAVPEVHGRKAARGLFGRMAKQTKKEESTAEQKEETPSYVDESRIQEVKSLEERAAGFAPLEGPLEKEKNKKQNDAFEIMTGLLFILDALILAYFILPQASFVLGYIAETGVSTFLLSWNYDYGTTLINMILAVLTLLAGTVLLTRTGKGYLVSGVICASMILAVSFEYLTSNATYLLLVSGISFMGLGALAYSRMSSVGVIEADIAPEDVNWPRFETF